jgi:aryl-alcohol dehydrogenase-like predicted oxidoreductase
LNRESIFWDYKKMDMKYADLGNSDIQISKLTFGAWAIGGWMWGGTDEKEAIRAIEASIDWGMTTIDTAPVYGFGKSEILIGKAIGKKRSGVQILTKYGLRWEDRKGEFHLSTADETGRKVDIYKYAAPESVINECEESLRRLKTDYIDLFQIHWPDPTTPIESTMEAVLKLKEQGKIRAAGVCNYTADQMKIAEKIVAIETNQVPYNMVLRDIEKDVVPYCLETGKDVLAYSPLQRGILTGKITPGYKFNTGDNRPDTIYYKEPNLSRINHFLSRIKPLADSLGLSLAQLVLCWTMQQPAINGVLAGARNPGQVKENIKAAEITLQQEIVDTIERELTDLHLDFK